jgi:hypothetical protein
MLQRFTTIFVARLLVHEHHSNGMRAHSHTFVRSFDRLMYHELTVIFTFPRTCMYLQYFRLLYGPVHTCIAHCSKRSVVVRLYSDTESAT